MSQEQNKNMVTSLLTSPIGLASGTAASIEIASLLAHWGPTGAVVGVIGGMVALTQRDYIVHKVKSVLPQQESVTQVIPQVVPPMHGRKRTLLEKAQGIFPDEESPTLPKQDKEAMPTTSGKETDMQTPYQETGTVPPLFPAYPEDETLRLGTVVTTGQRFDPHFNALIGKGWVAAANQGFGKSILNGVIIERAGMCGLPVIVLDHKGEYHTVKELQFMNALLVGSSGPDYELAIDEDPDVTAQDVDALVEHVMQGRYQAIINLPSYGSGWLGKATISAAIGQALMRYAEKQRRLGNKLLPCLVIMDEAQLYLPQDQTLLPPEALKNSAVLAELKNAYFALVSNGRSAGYTLGFATQSLTYIAKWAIKSSQVKIFGRHVEKNDLDMCEQSINPAIATREDIQTFGPGECVVFGLTPQPMIVQFDKKQSRDESETPKIEMLRNAQRTALPEQHVQRAYAPVAQQYSPSQPQRPVANPSDNVTQFQRWRQQSVPNAMEDVQPKETTQPIQHTMRHKERNDKAIAIWHELEVKGMANMRDFAVAFEVPESQAYKLLCDLERQHLIRWERRKKKA